MRETALARAEEKIAALTGRNAHLEADVQLSRTNIEKRVEEFNVSLQRERTRKRWRPPARTIHGCKARWQRCIRL